MRAAVKVPSGCLGAAAATAAPDFSSLLSETSKRETGTFRPTMSASASVRVTGPLADLMYSVLPSTLSMVPATRWVCCYADAVETANTAAKATAATIRIMLMSDLPKGAAANLTHPGEPIGGEL